MVIIVPQHHVSCIGMMRVPKSQHYIYFHIYFYVPSVSVFLMIHGAYIAGKVARMP